MQYHHNILVEWRQARFLKISVWDEFQSDPIFRQPQSCEVKHLGITNMNLFCNWLKKMYTNKPAPSYNLFQNFGSTDIQFLWTNVEFICFKIIIPNSFSFI